MVALCIVSTLTYNDPFGLVVLVYAVHNLTFVTHKVTYKYYHRYHKRIQALVLDTLLDKYLLQSWQYFVYVRFGTCKRKLELRRRVCHSWKNAFCMHWRINDHRNRMLDVQLSSMTRDSFGCFGNVFCLCVPFYWKEKINKILWDEKWSLRETFTYNTLSACHQLHKTRRVVYITIGCTDRSILGCTVTIHGTGFPNRTHICAWSNMC